MLRKTLLTSAAVLMFSATAALAQTGDRLPQAEANDTTAYEKWSNYVSDTTVARFVVNECLIASVGAVTVGLVLAATPVNPAMAAAVGVFPEYSAVTVAALSCAGGVAAGVSSAAVAWVWEERDVIGETMVAQAAGALTATANAGMAVAATVEYAWRDPQGASQTALTAVANATSVVIEQSRGLAQNTVQVAASVVAVLQPPTPAALRSSVDVASAERIVSDDVWVY